MVQLTGELMLANLDEVQPAPAPPPARPANTSGSSRRNCTRCACTTVRGGGFKMNQDYTGGN